MHVGLQLYQPARADAQPGFKPRPQPYRIDSIQAITRQMHSKLHKANAFANAFPDSGYVMRAKCEIEIAIRTIDNEYAKLLHLSKHLMETVGRQIDLVPGIRSRVWLQMQT